MKRFSYLNSVVSSVLLAVMTISFPSPSLADSGDIVAAMSVSKKTLDTLERTGKNFRKAGIATPVRIQFPINGESTEFLVVPHSDSFDSSFRPQVVSKKGVKKEKRSMTTFKSVNGEGLSVRFVLLSQKLKNGDKERTIEGYLHHGDDIYRFYKTTNRKSKNKSKSIDLNIEKVLSDPHAGESTSCGGDHAASDLTSALQASAERAVASAAITSTRPPVVIKFGVEADARFNTLTLSRGNDPTAYIIALVDQLNSIFQSQLNVRFNLVHLRIFTGSDPFSGNTGDAAAYLGAFSTYASNNAVITASGAKLVHFMTGKRIQNGAVSGAGDIGLVCFMRGISFTSFDSGTPTFAWHRTNFAHEIGHNFGMNHQGSGIMQVGNPDSMIFNATNKQQANSLLQGVWNSQNHDSPYRCLIPDGGTTVVTRTLRGRVTLNSATGSPLTNVIVKLNGAETAYTDYDGRFVFNPIPSGSNYALTFAGSVGNYTFNPSSAAGTLTSDTDLNVIAQAVATDPAPGVNSLVLAGKNVSHTQSAGVATYSVHAVKAGIAQPGVKVTAVYTGPKGITKAILTNRYGLVTFKTSFSRSTLAGNYQIVISAPGYQSYSDTFTIKAPGS